MGAPKKIKRKYSTPKKPYDRARLDKERKIKQDFGLRRKKEIWRAEAQLRKFRQRARELQAKPDETEEKVLFDKIRKIGIDVARLEDILVIRLEDMLSRRLQTVVYKKGFAHTAMQARQFIVHGHVYVDGRKSVWPGHIIERGQEDLVMINPSLVKEEIKKDVEAGKEKGKERGKK